MVHRLFCAFAMVLWVSVTIRADESGSATMMRVAGYQMEIGNDIPQNKKRILAAIDRAREAKADFLMTPEGSLSGYTDQFDRETLQAALEEVTLAAREAQVGLLLGTCYKELVAGEERCWNQVRVYAPDGKHLGNHSKILRCSPIEEPGTGEMLRYDEAPLTTFRWKGIRFGCLVCNDLWATPGYTTKANPYLPLKLRQQGAQAIFHVINSGKSQRYRSFHESSVNLWAHSLQIPIFEVNASKGELPVNARSGLVNQSGERTEVVPDVGEQFFVREIAF